MNWFSLMQNELDIRYRFSCKPEKNAPVPIEAE